VAKLGRAVQAGQLSFGTRRLELCTGYFATGCTPSEVEPILPLSLYVTSGSSRGLACRLGFELYLQAKTGQLVLAVVALTHRFILVSCALPRVARRLAR
jgi:hypothetical protein